MPATSARGRLAALHTRATTGHARALALAGAGAISFSSIFVRVSHASPSTAAIFRCVYALPLLAVLARRERSHLGPRSRRERGAALAAGVFFGIDNLLWNRSIIDVGAGLATVLVNIQVVVLPLAAWLLLRERPDRRLVAALPLAALGVLLISGALEHGAYGRAPGRGTVFALAGGLSYVGFLLLLRGGARNPRAAAGPLFDVTLSGAVSCIIGGLAIGDARLVPAWPSAGWLLALALGSQVIGWLLLSSSLPRLQASVGAVLLTAQPIGSVALGVVLLGESPSALQFLGVACVLGALLTAGLARAAGEVSAEPARGPAPALEASQS